MIEANIPKPEYFSDVRLAYLFACIEKGSDYNSLYYSEGFSTKEIVDGIKIHFHKVATEKMFALFHNSEEPQFLASHREVEIEFNNHDQIFDCDGNIDYDLALLYFEGLRLNTIYKILEECEEDSFQAKAYNILLQNFGKFEDDPFYEIFSTDGLTALFAFMRMAEREVNQNNSHESPLERHATFQRIMTNSMSTLTHLTGQNNNSTGHPALFFQQLTKIVPFDKDEVMSENLIKQLDLIKFAPETLIRINEILDTFELKHTNRNYKIATFRNKEFIKRIYPLLPPDIGIQYLKTIGYLYERYELDSNFVEYDPKDEKILLKRTNQKERLYFQRYDKYGNIQDVYFEVNTGTPIVYLEKYYDPDNPTDLGTPYIMLNQDNETTITCPGARRSNVCPNGSNQQYNAITLPLFLMDKWKREKLSKDLV